MLRYFSPSGSSSDDFLESCFLVPLAAAAAAGAVASSLTKDVHRSVSSFLPMDNDTYYSPYPAMP